MPDNPLPHPTDALGAPAAPAASGAAHLAHPADPAGDDAAWRQALALPKVLLHEHLDGALRPATLLELLARRGIAPPAADLPSLEAWFDARAHAGSLTEYLRGFALTVTAMADLEAMERVAFEAAEDSRLDGIVLAEFRIAPLLFEPHGIDADAAVQAMVAGLARSALPCGLIVCAMRQEPPAEVARAAALAIRHAGRGVIGFDLAGPEAGFPPSLHADALARVRAAGLPLTLHAGEADAAERVLEAGRLGARRIGHGVRLVDALDRGDDALLDAVRALDLHLELCPTSNVQTGAAASIAAHPIGRLWRAGLEGSVNTDNRLISRITLSREVAGLLRAGVLGWDELAAMQRAAARRSFLPEAERRAAAIAIADWQSARPAV